MTDHLIVRPPAARPVVRRDDPPAPVHEFDPPVPVVVTNDHGESFPGLAWRWRGQWVHCTWTRGVGLRHTGWVLAEDVARA